MKKIVALLLAMVMVLSMTACAKTEAPKAEEKQEKKHEQPTKKEEKKTEPTTTTPVVDTKADANSMPSTGPEDAVLPILLIAASAYLISLNVSWAKRGLKDEEKA